MDVNETGAEDEQEEQVEVEVEPLRMARNPKLPPAADVELHDRIHIPFPGLVQVV